MALTAAPASASTNQISIIQEPGMLDNPGTFIPIDAPDAGTGNSQGTQPSTNNAGGEVVGWYIDGNNVSHGFVWRP